MLKKIVPFIVVVTLLITGAAWGSVTPVPNGSMRNCSTVFPMIDITQTTMKTCPIST